MARLRVPAPDFGDEAPVNASLYFTKALTANGRSLTAEGLEVADIWACLRARCREWTLTFDANVTGNGDEGSFLQSISGTWPLDFTNLTIPDGYADHPEVGLISDLNYSLIETVTNNSVGGPVGSTVVNSTPPGFDINFLQGLMTLTGQPILYGSQAYFPFHLSCTFVDIGRSDRNLSVATNQTGPQIGVLALKIPNWRAGGTVQVNLPLYRISSYPGYTGVSATVTMSLAPAANSYLKYGNGPANENPVWNSSGMSLVDPLAH